MIGELFLFAAMACAVVGAVMDVRTRRIPNGLVLVLGLCAAGATIFAAGWTEFGWAAIHALIALVVGMGLFAIRAIGAGDAKFYSAAAFGIPLGEALPMLGWVAVSGLVVLLGMFAWHRGPKVYQGEEKTSWTLPYAVPIAIGFLAVTYAELGQPILWNELIS